MFRGLIIANLGVALVAIFLTMSRPEPPPEVQGVLLPDGREISSFTLIDHRDQAFTKENLKGHWHLVSYGFITCPDICPTTLSQINTMVRNLQNSKSI